MPDSPISTPAGYAPAFAIGFSDAGSLAMVDAARPLPVTIQAATGAMLTPLQGSATGTAQAGPFAPAADRAVMLTLSGSWQGTCPSQALDRWGLHPPAADHGGHSLG